MATSFDGHTHGQLRAMIASLGPGEVRQRAEQLARAAEDIARIAEKLKGHRVPGWEGEGATAFEEWVGRAANATLRLSEYSAVGSAWMGETVQWMIEATKMPLYDTAAARNLDAARTHHNDPDAPGSARRRRRSWTTTTGTPCGG